MDKFLQLTFADSIEIANRLFLMRDDTPDLGGFKKLAADFAAVGKSQHNNIQIFQKTK